MSTRINNRHIVRYALLLFSCISSVHVHAQQATSPEPGSATVPTIIPFAAKYKASANGLTATASRSLTSVADGRLVLSNELQATVLGQEIARLQQRSEFHVNGDLLVSDSYNYEVSGITSDQRSIEFNWDSRSAVSREDDKQWTIPLSDNVYDPLSHQFALSQQLRLSGSDLTNTNTPVLFAFDVVDGDEIETHQYQLLGQELLSTPLGALNSLKFERVRADSSSRSTLIWLAPDWDFLLARIEQVNGSGLQIKLELESATVGNRGVTPLP